MSPYWILSTDGLQVKNSHRKRNAFYVNSETVWSHELKLVIGK